MLESYQAESEVDPRSAPAITWSALSARAERSKQRLAAFDERFIPAGGGMLLLTQILPAFRLSRLAGQGVSPVSVRRPGVHYGLLECAPGDTPLGLHGVEC